MNPILALAIALVAATSLAGCSAETVGPKTPKFEDGAYVINIIPGNHFSPADAKVPLNSTVKWITSDTTPHDVSDADNNPARWSSDDDGPKLSANGRNSYTHTFATAGTFHYQCDLHASTGMKGTITVG